MTTAPILRHFDLSKDAVIVVYTSKWAISASLVQDYDGLFMPVTFTSRILKANEFNCSTVEKEGCLEIWAALLSQWILEIVKCKKREDQVLEELASSITPRESVDSILSAIASKKQAKQKIDLPTPTVEKDEELYVLSFGGSARVKQGGGICSAVVYVSFLRGR
uniref:Reverse transcriptase/retrotransposon-derived protein RNase H-like domain-containing protein n=1 Tax=Peronospora matthiolae TaxID=2874970 RepID=A0AAV1UDV9_9STRA